MNIRCVLLLSCCFLLNACQEKSALNEDVQVDDITPESISASESKLNIGSVYGRKSSNLIDVLFEEAVEKNSEVAQLEKKRTALYDEKWSLLKDFKKYDNINQRYWSSAKQYISQISDSILRERTLMLFDSLEQDYDTKTTDLSLSEYEVKQNQSILNDQYLLFKLWTTQAMIQNYQNNEKPDAQPIRELNEDYKDLIEEVKVYNKKKK